MNSVTYAISRNGDDCQTSDLTLSAYLLLKGRPLKRWFVDSDGRRVWFLFDGYAKCEGYQRELVNGHDSVSATEFTRKVRAVRELARAALTGERVV